MKYANRKGFSHQESFPKSFRHKDYKFIKALDSFRIEFLHYPISQEEEALKAHISQTDIQ